MKPIIFPKPKSDTRAYEAMLKKGLSNYPQRGENYKRYKQGLLGVELNYLPIKMDIEPNSSCNLKCKICLASEFKNNKRAKDLSCNEFKKIIDSQYGLTEIKIQGLGEPFLCADFIRMVRYASDNDIWVRTTTNGTLLGRKEYYKKIIDAGIGEIQISMDGVTKKTYEKIRIKSNFGLVSGNCSLINGYCQKCGIDKTRMWVVLQKENFHELFKFPVFAKELGFKRLTISLEVNSWGSRKWAQKNNRKKVSHKVSQHDIDILLREAKGLGLDLTFWDVNEKYTKENPCLWPFERSYITSDMKIVPCCMIGDPQIVNFGNADNFQKIWESGVYLNFRRAHLEGRVPSFCKSCYQ